MAKAKNQRIIRRFGEGIGYSQATYKLEIMNIYVPGVAVGAFISLYIFYEYNRVQKAKREERREYLNERRQEILDSIIKAKKDKPNTP